MLSKIQRLLHKEAGLANRRRVVQLEIEKLRGTEPPYCWGTDDCSTMMLSQCAWRNDCNSPKAVNWQILKVQ